MMNMLNEEELNKVNGGEGETSVQIYLRDEALDMNTTIGTLMSEHPELSPLLTAYPVINYVKNMTLNNICPSLISQATLQSEIDKATGYTRA